MVRRLPSRSRYIEALANDDEYAESIGEQDPGPDKGPRLHEYTPEVARLDLIIDRIGELYSATIQLNGGKAPRIRPSKRPETAFSRAERRRTDQRLGSLIAEVEAAQERAAKAHN